MDWLFPAAVFLWGVYLVWKVDKLEAELKKLRSVPLQLDDQRALQRALNHHVELLEQRLDQLDALVDRRLYDLENPPPTPAQRDATERSLQLIDEQIAEEQKRADLTRP